jgi:hypothetical protein
MLMISEGHDTRKWGCVAWVHRGQHRAKECGVRHLLRSAFFFVSHGVAACATCAPRTQRKRHHGPDAMSPRVQTQAHNNVPAICPDDNLALLGHSCGRCSRLSSSDRSRGGVTHFCVFSLRPERCLSLSLTHTHTTTPPPHTQHTHTHTCTRLYLTVTLAIHPQEGLATVLALATPTALNTLWAGRQLFWVLCHSNNVELAKRGKRAHALAPALRRAGYITGLHCNPLGGSRGSRWHWAVRATAEGTHCVCE